MSRITVDPADVTEFRVTILDIDGFTVVGRYDNLHAGQLHGTLCQAHKAAVRIEGASVITEGRTRLNDFVGSPIMSDWQVIA